MRNHGSVVNVNTVTAIANAVNLSHSELHQPLIFTTSPCISTTSSPTINISCPTTTSASSSPMTTPYSTTSNNTFTFQQPQQSPPPTNRRGRKAGVKNYSDMQTTILLTIIEKLLPRGSDEWNNVTTEYIRTTKDIRDVASIKERFNRLSTSQKTTGDPEMIEHIRIAKQCADSIAMRDCVVELGGNYTDQWDILQHNDLKDGTSMWGHSHSGSTSSKATTTTTTTTTTTASQKKRKLDDAFFTLVDHITSDKASKNLTPTSAEISSITTLVANMSQQLQQQQQLMQDMQTQQQQMMNEIKQLHSQHTSHINSQLQ